MSSLWPPQIRGAANRASPSDLQGALLLLVGAADEVTGRPLFHEGRVKSNERTVAFSIATGRAERLSRKAARDAELAVDRELEVVLNGQRALSARCLLMSVAASVRVAIGSRPSIPKA
jgi:hypothetical protein